MIKAIYHLVPMWVWETLLLVGIIGLFILMVIIGLSFCGEDK